MFDANNVDVNKDIFDADHVNVNGEDDLESSFKNKSSKDGDNFYARTKEVEKA